MGLFTKKEKFNPESGKFEAVEKEPLFKRRVDSKELTREEQIEPQRQQPWKTERGKRVIKSVKKVGSRIDAAVVRYNRTRNPMRGNANPFGATFDRGMTPMKKPKSKGKKKYILRGGVAYPIAGTGKKKHKKRKQKSKSRKFSDPFDMDFGKQWGGW